MHETITLERQAEGDESGLLMCCSVAEDVGGGWNPRRVGAGRHRALHPRAHSHTGTTPCLGATLS